jgi:hypothetical protein
VSVNPWYGLCTRVQFLVREDAHPPLLNIKAEVTLRAHLVLFNYPFVKATVT